MKAPIAILCLVALSSCSTPLIGADEDGGAVSYNMGIRSDAVARAKEHCEQYDKRTIITDSKSDTITFKCVEK